jgi:hypothetical protein
MQAGFIPPCAPAPKVFALQKRFSATPTFFLQAVESLNVDIAVLYANHNKILVFK